MAKKKKVNPPKSQTCTSCGVNQKIHCYSENNTAKNGYLRRCKSCVNEKARIRLEAQRNGTWEGDTIISTLEDDILRVIKLKATKMRSNAATRSKKAAKLKNRPKKIVVEITTDEIVQKIYDSHLACEKTGIPFSFESSEKGEATIFSPSLDRKSPGKGYTVANTQVVISGYNSLKGVGTDLQCLQIASAIVNKNS